jgi:mono/diheme cytochrome c family protein
MDFRVSKLAALSPFLIAGLLAPSLGCRSDGVIDPGQQAEQKPGATPASAAGGSMGTGMVGPNGVPGAMTGMPGAPARGITDSEMPADVLAVLQGRCAGCHTYGQADPAGWGSVLDVSRMIDADIIVPGNPDASRLIDRVAVAGDMPPRGERVPSDDVALLRKWISDMKRNAANPPTDTDILDEIAVDQLRLRDRSSDYRYVSFAHFMGEGRTDKEMEAVRQVFTFVMNSLSRRGQVVDLPTIDQDKSIFRIRLSDLGWSEALWDTLTSFYPYCLRSDAAAHESLYAQLRTEAPVVRGDWLLATATKSPLYETLIDLPANLDDLAARLGINIDNDINHPGLAEPDNLLRIGFRRSGVALHNRMIERHLGAAGQSLWVSYDFASNEGTSDVLANPLGPAARDQQKFVHNFEHAGGMVIFTMPSGLQGYMVVNAAGDRLAEVPLNIARDPRRRNGAVDNALSCFGCHGLTGILAPRETDETPRYTDTHIANFLGRELNEVDASYPRALRPDPLLGDSMRYRSVAATVPGGGPPAGDGEYGEFIAMVGQYEANVGFHGAAAEFNEEFESFRQRVLANDFQNDALPRLPTAPLLSRDDFVCVFRDIVTKIRPNAVFCAKTFDAAAVRNQCLGGVSTGNNGNGNGNSNGGASGAATGGRSGSASGTGGRSGATGGSSGRGTGGTGGNVGTGGRGGSSGGGGSSGNGAGGAAGSNADAGTDAERCTRIDGRRVCR